MSTSNSAAPRVVVWGEVLWDRFPDGDQLGGAPANVAFHLAQLAPALGVALATRVGVDADGERALGQLHRAGVDVTLAQRDGARATGEVAIQLDGSEPRYRLVPGRAWERIFCTTAIRAALQNAAAVVYGTLAQRTWEGLTSFRSMLAVAPASCLRVCDPNLRPGTLDLPALRAALDAADVVKLGERELATCADALGDGDLLATLRRRCKLVAITRGAAGSTLYAGDEIVPVAAIAATPGGDNVGCGDAYVAMLTAGVVLGWPLVRTGAIASRWAAYVAGVRGATPTLPAATVAAILDAD